MGPVSADGGTHRANRTTLRLTPAGVVLLPIALIGLLLSLTLVGKAALVTATVCALLALAPVASTSCLRGLSVRAPAPRQAFVGEGFAIELSVTNRAWLLTARHVFLWHGHGRRRDPVPSGRLDAIAPGETRRVPTAHRMFERGRHEKLRLVMASSFPFGLVECRREFSLPVDFLALPCPGHLRDMRRLQRARSGMSVDLRRPLFGEEELYGLREWREGESLRRAHWKISARRGRTILREFRGAGRAPVQLVLSTWVPAVGAGRHPSFEKAVSLTATLCEYFLREGHRLRLVLDGPEPIDLHSVRGGRTLLVFLAVLAEVKAHQGDPHQVVRALPSRPGHEEIFIAVLAGGGREKTASAGEDVIVFDVDDPDTERVFQRGRPAALRPPLTVTGDGA